MKTNDYSIRLEKPEDCREVENLVRESFWNVYRPGCSEHFVVHVLRDDPAFVKELDFVMRRSVQEGGPADYSAAEKDGKLIAEKIVSFDDVPRRVWLRFPSYDAWKEKEQEVLRTVADHGGRDQVVIYIEDRKARKTLPPGQGIRAGEAVIGLLEGICGRDNVVLQ